MSLIAQNKPKEYELCPKGRKIPIICCDVEQPEAKRYQKRTKQGDIIPGQYDVVERVRFLFLSGGPRMNDGRPFMLRATFGLSLGPGTPGSGGTKLRKFMGWWRGEPLTDDEVKPPGIQVEPWAIARCGLANIVHNVDDEKRVWANIDLLEPLENDPVVEAMLKDLLVGYVRMKDRQERQMAREAKQMFNGQETPF